MVDRGDETGLQRTRLIRARKKRGLSRAELGRKLGISYAHIHRIEEGFRNPSFPVMERWAAALGCSITIFRDDVSKAA